MPADTVAGHATRIDIELTSVSGDGSGHGAPPAPASRRASLDGSILPAGAAVGDQLRVEIEQDVDGIRILSIVPPKQKAGRSDLLEMLPSTDFEPVTQQRVGARPPRSEPRTPPPRP